MVRAAAVHLVGACLFFHALPLSGFYAPALAPSTLVARPTLSKAGLVGPTRANVGSWSGVRTSKPAGALGLECQAAGRSTGKSTGNRVCIVGGGFGGLFTAMKLANLAPLQPEGGKAEITLIDPRDRFVFLPLLYELVTGEMRDWEVAPVFADLLQGTGIRFVQGSALRIDRDAREVEVAVAPVAGGGSKVVEYDTLVLASGAEQVLPAKNGAAAHALAFLRAEDARELRRRIAAARAERRTAGTRGKIVIVGGGYSGVELATSVARDNADWADVTLLHRGERILPSAQRFNRITAQQELQRAGVKVRTLTSVLAVDPKSVTMAAVGDEAAEERLPADVVVWTAGSGASKLPTLGGFPTAPDGRVPVGPRLLVQGRSDTYALGDVAECYDALGARMAGTAQVAIQQAECVAWNVHAGITGGVPVPFRYQDLGEAMTFGPGSSALASRLFGIQARPLPLEPPRGISTLPDRAAGRGLGDPLPEKCAGGGPAFPHTRSCSLA
jgi:NADH:ubiquinone reductase (non-electrogenic)